MKCPVCKETDLLMTERQQIEIDYCPNCRGVWLDRGELDRLIEKSSTPIHSEAATQPPYREREQQVYSQPSHHDHYKTHKHYKRKSLLGEIFDF